MAEIQKIEQAKRSKKHSCCDQPQDRQRARFAGSYQESYVRRKKRDITMGFGMQTTRAYLVFLFLLAVLATAWQPDDIIRHSSPASAEKFASIAFVGIAPHFQGDHTMQKWKRTTSPRRRNAASTVLSRRTQFSFSRSKMTSQKAHDSDESSLLKDEKFSVSTNTMEQSQRCSWVGVPDVLESLPVHAEVQARRSATILPIIVPNDHVVANNSSVDSSFLERQPPHNFTIERLSKSPPIFLLRNVLTSEECNTIMDAVSSGNGGLLEDAETVSGNSGIARPHSQVAWLPSSTEGIGELAWSMSQMLMPMSNGCEDMQVVHYKGNGKGEYHLHHDGNERFLTILYYLNGVGGTWFPFATTSDDENQPLLLRSRTEALQLASTMVPGRDGVVLVDAQTIVDGENWIPIAKGDAVAFYSYTKPNDRNAGEEEYDMDWRAMHAGLPSPATTGKWIANHWYHAPRQSTP
eukprot:scaffold35224_cov55-Attheya_sp.AAC.5